MDLGFVHGGPMSSAELRKIRKPIIERRRRERINRCLDQIKSLVLKALNQDESKYEKMDKADILEMAVRHLLDNERTKMRSAYRTGFNRCTSEVKTFLQSSNNNNNNNTTNNNMLPDYNDVQKRLIGHLSQPVPCNRLPSPPAGICRPQPMMPSLPSVPCSPNSGTLQIPSHRDSSDRVTLMAKVTTTSLEDEDCLNCSTVSSTSSVLSPNSQQRQRRDSGLSEDFSPDKSSLSDFDPFDHPSAFRKIHSTSSDSLTRAACLGLAEYAMDSDEDSDSDSDLKSGSPTPSGQEEVDETSSPVWRPWK